MHWLHALNSGLTIADFEFCVTLMVRGNLGLGACVRETVKAPASPTLLNCFFHVLIGDSEEFFSLYKVVSRLAAIAALHR